MNPDDLIKKANEGVVIYAIVIRFISTKISVTRINVAMTFHMLNAEKFTKNFFEYKKFENVFSNEQIKKFFEHEFDDHVINIENKKSSFDSLYNLSIIKFKTLRKYLNNLLNKN